MTVKDHLAHEPTEKEKKEESLKRSFKDGIFASAMNGFTLDYFTPFLLLLGGTAKHVSILSSLPNLFAALVQLKSADYTEKVGSRKKVFKFFVLMQALMLLPMALIAMKGDVHPMVFILFVTLFTAFGAFATPAWGSLMSDLVAENKRGEYFGWRNKVLGLIVVGSSLAGGIMLQHFKQWNPFRGFILLFSLACLFRVISWCYLIRMYEPKLVHKEDDRFTIVRFLARIRQSNFARFVLFVSLMNFSVNIASPYFAVLMLRDLHFNYIMYSVVQICAPLTVYLLIGRWGRHADQVGNLKVMRLTAPIIAALPILWIFNRHPAFLIAAQIVSGFAWAGFNLSASNFILDAVTPAKRTRCISYFNVLNGLALCGGALAGGLIVMKLPPLFGYKILSLFLVSSILRMLVGLFVPLQLKEVRNVEKVRSVQLFFSMIGMRPILGIERKTIQY